MEARLILRGLTAAAAGALLLAAGPPASGQRPGRLDAALAAAKADMLVNPERAIRRAHDALALAGQEPDARTRDIARASAQWLIGEADGRLSKPRVALPLLTAAATTIARVDAGSVLEGDILLSRGSILTDLGRVDEALSTLQHAHDVYRAAHEARSQAKTLIMIALLYNGARDFGSALRYFDQAAEAFGTDRSLRMAIESGRGTALVELGRDGDAERAFARSVALARAIESVAVEAVALTNLANAQLLQHRIDAAARSTARGLLLTRDPAAETTRPFFVLLKAKIALQRGQLAQSAALLDQRFRGIDLSLTTLNDREAHAVAYDVYRRLGRADDALAHLAALKRLDDQATAIARSNSAALATAKFDFQNQELRIAKLKADDLQKSVAIERQSARAQRIIFGGAAAATLAIIALLAFGVLTLRRSRNQIRRANTELEGSNAALNKALAAKTEFLATTSHEIRTPLNGILGMTQVMAAEPGLDPAMRDRIAVVHGAGETMRALVDDILDVAKIESGRMTIEDAPLDLAATVAEAARLWREPAQRKGLDFTVEPGASAWMLGDSARLRQILFNLLSNAVKFTSDGFVRLTCSASDTHARIVVADSGIGIDPAVHEVIFESFRQADATTTRQFGGTGLGLSICRNLARAMGGDITVESRAGEGARFTLALPIRAARDPAPMRDLAAVVVERNPIARATLRALLEPHGSCAFVATLPEAEAAIGPGRTAALLVDGASIDGELDAVAALAARCGASAILLLAPDAPPVAATDMTVLRRPVRKQVLIEHVFYAHKTLACEAA